MCTRCEQLLDFRGMPIYFLYISLLSKLITDVKKNKIQDASFIPNGNPNGPVAEGMNGPEVAQRLHSLVLYYPR